MCFFSVDVQEIVLNPDILYGYCVYGVQYNNYAQFLSGLSFVWLCDVWNKLFKLNK